MFLVRVMWHRDLAGPLETHSHQVKDCWTDRKQMPITVPVPQTVAPFNKWENEKAWNISGMFFQREVGGYAAHVCRGSSSEPLGFVLISGLKGSQKSVPGGN